jgi:hypothetical protein
MGQRADGFVKHNSAMIDDLLELSRGPRTSMRGQIGFAPHVNRCPKLVWN